jgi:hypothetical protein
VAHTYFITSPSLDSRVLPLVLASDWTPTTYYYGRVTLSQFFEEEEAERLGLYLADEEAEDREAERSALYRAEMGYRP